MKTARKQILQRMLALLMSVCMVLGLLPAEPVKAETTGPLVIATNFELGDNGTVTWHNPDDRNQTGDNYASGNSQIDCNTKSLKVYFGLQTAESTFDKISPWDSNSTITGITVGYASEYTEGESGNNTTVYGELESSVEDEYLTFEQPTYWMVDKQGNGSNHPYADVVEIHFHKSGYYKFTYQDSSAYINVSLPTFGIYTQNTASWEALLDESYGYSREAEEVTLYAITNFIDENETSRTDFTLTCKSGEEEFKKIICTPNSSESSTQVYTLTFRPDDMGDDEWVEFDLSYKEGENSDYHENAYVTFVKKSRGLVVIKPDWDEAGEPYCSPDPFCRKSLEAVSVGLEEPVYLGIVGEDDKLELISDINQISVDAGLTIRKATDNDGETIFYIQPSQAGDYTITCNTINSGNTVSVNAVLPKLAFYKRAELSNDAYISVTADFGETDGDRTIYLIAREDEWLKLSADAKPVFSCDNSENSVNVAAYIDYKDVTNTVNVLDAKKVYQINLKWSHTFNLGVHLSYTEVEGSATEEIYSNPVHLNYKGVGEQEPEDDNVIRYEGDDGKDLCGFSGCFITEEAYLTGRNWFNGAYPDQIFYWVHDTSIQNVVDRLLEVAGTEMELLDLKTDQTVTMKIPNTGYILLNMSYRDSDGKAAAQKEQYVYAPASIKGILMNSDVYVYSIPKTHAEGGDIKEEDTGNTIYDDVLEIQLKAGNAGTVTHLGENAEPQQIGDEYIHGVWINVEEKWAVIDEYGEEKLATFQKMVAGGTEDDPKYLIRKTTYNESQDCWEKTDFYYVINRSDVVLPEDGKPVEGLTTLQAEPYRWPSIHVNASTHVRVQGLWASGAQLYVGYYEGVDSVSTYVYDQTYTAKDIGNTYPVSYIWRNPHYNTEKEYCEETEETASVTVHVVKAESNTNINDNYSEGDKKAQIVVDKEAISDLIPLDNEQEKKTLIDGGRLDLDMSIDKVDTETAGEEVTGAVDQIKKNQGNNKNKQTDFVDINLKYVIKDISASGVDKKALTETETEMIVSLPLKDSMKNKKKYVVYRYHEGNVDILYAWIDEDTGNLCFETDQFSVYAIEAGDGETQTSTGSSTGGTSSGGTSSGSASTDSSKTQTKPDGTTVETSAETKMDGTKVETTVETKTDGTKTETVVETAKDGSVKTTETVTQADGSATKTEKENETNSKGKDVAVTTTTKTDATGEVTAITEKSVIAQSSATTSTTVTVEKDADGTIKDASANIAKTIASGNKATVAASIVAQIVEAAGTGDVQITMSVRDSDGKLKYKVEVSAEDLKAGEELYIYKRNTKTGEYTMVNAKTYEVSKNGNVAVSMSKKATYELVTEKQAAAINKEIKNTIKPKKSSATVEQGKTTRFALSAKANPDNIKSIVYTTSKKSVATVSKNGKITAKGTGTVIIQAKVTLMNGQIKTIRMKLRVKEEL